MGYVTRQRPGSLRCWLRVGATRAAQSELPVLQRERRLLPSCAGQACARSREHARTPDSPTLTRSSSASLFDAPRDLREQRRRRGHGRVVRREADQRLQAHRGAAVRPRLPDGLFDAAHHIQAARRAVHRGQGVVQARRHLQHGRVRRAAARAPGELPLVHVGEFVSARRHPAAERAHPRRQRARPRCRVQAVREADRRGGRDRALPRGHRPRRTHRLQRAGLVARRRARASRRSRRRPSSRTHASSAASSRRCRGWRSRWASRRSSTRRRCS